MRHRHAIIAATLAATVLLAGCALQARTDANPHASLSQCRTYAWGMAGGERGQEAAFANPLNDKRLRDAISAQLQSRGGRIAGEGEQADCLVRYAIGSRLAVDPGYPRASWSLGWGFGWGRRGYGSFGYDMPFDYREGRVSLDVTDARNREPLWHAYVEADVTNLTGDAADKRINDVVGALFAKFPSGAAAPAPAAGGQRG